MYSSRLVALLFIVIALSSILVEAKGLKKGVVKYVKKIVKTTPPKNRLVIALGPTPPPPPPPKPIITTPRPPAEKELCQIKTDPSDIFILTIVRKTAGKISTLPPIILDNSKVSISLWVKKGLGFLHQLKKYLLWGNKYSENVSVNLQIHPSMIGPLPPIYKTDLLMLTIISTYQGKLRVKTHLIDIVGLEKLEIPSTLIIPTV